MPTEPAFNAAFPYQHDVLALPVTDLDAASAWYANHFGMTEVERHNDPSPTVILKRDGMRLGFAVNGRDASQDGAAIRVTNIQQIRSELEAKGVKPGDLKIDERSGERFHAFFVVAPDGLCYYFHEPIEAEHCPTN